MKVGKWGAEAAIRALSSNGVPEVVATQHRHLRTESALLQHCIWQERVRNGEISRLSALWLKAEGSACQVTPYTSR